MADDSQRAKARSTFGSSFFENSKAIPAPKNFAAAQQKTANSRPIPTFKVGGAVKKADSGMPRNRPMPYDKMGSKLPRKADGGLTDVRKSAVMQRAMGDQPNVPMTGMGTQPMKVMKNGGKVMKKAEGGTVKPAPNKSGGKKDAEYGDYVIGKAKGGPVAKFFKKNNIGTYTDAKGRAVTNADLPENVRDAVKVYGARRNLAREAQDTKDQKENQRKINRLYDPKTRPEAVQKMNADGLSAGFQERRSFAKGGTVDPLKNKMGGKTDPEYGDYVISGRPKMPPPKKAAPRPTMPPKTGDKRDAEYGDYVIAKAMGGKVQTSSDTARKLATEMGGMKHGGVQKKSLGGVLKKIAPYAAIGLAGAALGKGKPFKAGALGAVGALMMGKKKKPIVPPAAGAAAAGAGAGAGAAAGTPVPGQPGVNKYFVDDTFDTTDKNKFMQVKKGGPVGKYAVGGAGKTRLGMAPIKRAQGGAAKVRKGMMTPKGKITPGVKPHKGIGAF